MANWNGQANSDEEGGGGGGFTAAPRGFYTIQVADFEDTMTKGDGGKPKRPMVKLTCEIADEGEHFGKKVWTNITCIPAGEKGHGLMLHALSAFGIKIETGTFNFDTADLQGRTARVLLGVETYVKVKDGRSYNNERNFIEAYYTEKHPQPDELPPAPAPKAAAPAAPSPTKAPSAAVQQVFGSNGAAKQKAAGVPF